MFTHMGFDPNNQFVLTLGDVLHAAGVDPAAVLVIRHTYKSDGLASRAETSPEAVLAYTRVQHVKPGKIPADPPRWWLIFMAESGRRCRLLTVFDNAGEVMEERTDTHRSFQLQESGLLRSLHGQLLIEWSKDPVNWAKRGLLGAKLPVVEIADPHVVEFPGYDKVLLPYAELLEMVGNSRYTKWQAALGAVQGIYLVADTVTGKLYVGKADGGERIWGRWTTYARDGHGGNIAMRELIGHDPNQPGRYLFSILQVFGPQIPRSEIDAAEIHFKRALLSRKHGLMAMSTQVVPTLTI